LTSNRELFHQRAAVKIVRLHRYIDRCGPLIRSIQKIMLTSSRWLAMTLWA